MAIASVNPATANSLRSFTPLSENALEEKLQLAAGAARRQRALPLETRTRLLTRVADQLESSKESLGCLITTEMGKPRRAAVQEVEECAAACRYYAEHAAAMLQDELVETPARRSFVRYQPLGVVLAVMPWNFPFWQVFRFAAPALAAGNVGLLKHASNVPQCALAIETVIRRAGFEEGAFQALLIGSDLVQRVIEDPRVAAVTLTGSEEAGLRAAATVGRLIKKSVMELGGSDPFIVLPSADLDAAVSTAVQARILNNGQSCIAAKRFIVAEPIYDAFQAQFVARMEALKVGDPMDEPTDVGPLATRDILDTLEDQVNRAVAAGARVLTGGHKLGGPGYYYAPTVLTDIPLHSPARQEELFGPVASLFRVAGLDEAIALANDTTFGLGASVWTTDAEEQEQLIDGIESGMVFVNAMVASSPPLPFGGVKNSGFGRELGAVGMREFMNAKSVWVQ